MGIGVGIFLIAVGLILALAVDATVSGVDIQLVGWILVAVGVLGILLDLVMFAPRRRYGAADVRSRAVVEERPVTEERTIYRDDPRY